MITLRHSINAAVEMYDLSGKRQDPNSEPGRDGDYSGPTGNPDNCFGNRKMRQKFARNLDELQPRIRCGSRLPS